MNIKVTIFSWGKYIQGTKHHYAKILVDGRLVAENGGRSDRLTFYTKAQAMTWAEGYIRENYPKRSWEWKFVGDKPHKKRRWLYAREGD